MIVFHKLPPTDAAGHAARRAAAWADFEEALDTVCGRMNNKTIRADILSWRCPLNLKGVHKIISC